MEGPFNDPQIPAGERVAYRGLVAESPNLSLPRRAVDAGKHVLDAWKRPLRIAHGDADAYGGAGVGVWSTGPDGGDGAGAGDDLASWTGG